MVIQQKSIIIKIIINKMEFLTVEHIPAKKASAHSSHINIKLEPGISEIVNEKEFPFKIYIKRILGDEIFYEIDLSPGMWMGHTWFEGCYLEIKTNTGKILHTLKWHPLTHGTTTDVMFYLWTLQNPTNCGIVIGSNDGTYGDYLIPFLERNIGEMIMVEASEKTFTKLKEKYKQFYNVKFLNKLITPNGGKQNFYELSENSKTNHLGYANSVYREMVELIDNDDNNIIEIEKDSISIMDLIQQSGYMNRDYFLYIDAEGLDADLLNSLDFSKIKRPTVIVWERGFGCDNSYAIPHLEKNGYTIYEEANENNIIAIIK
jgi:FkbM family methyltransferase